MFRGSVFVDGSNFLGSLSKMGIQVKNYEDFLKYVFDESVKAWRICLRGDNISFIMNRIYWYAVGTIDPWDFNKPETIAHLSESFHKDKQLKTTYMALAGKQNTCISQDDVAKKAWDLCFKEIKEWYNKKQVMVDGFKSFYYNVQRYSDFIEIIECGHWKVKPLSKSVSEKELDTRLAVDIVTMAEIYDFAIIISGDADVIPSIEYIKRKGKHVGIIELVKGYPPEKRESNFPINLMQ